MSTTIHKIDYEEFLALYSSTAEAIELLRQYRPYLELMPSMRRPEESLLTIPLPIVKVRHPQVATNHNFGQTFLAESIQIPCEIALLMCDPEWKVKTGREIFLFIHRPEEDLSELLSRWRQTQVLLSKEYEWIFPLRYQHMLNEGGDKLYPLFILSPDSPDRIRRGLKGAHLPFVTVPSSIPQPQQLPPQDTDEPLQSQDNLHSYIQGEEMSTEWSKELSSED